MKATTTCTHCGGLGFTMDETHSYPCLVCEANVYVDVNGPYIPVWMLFDLNGECASACHITDDPATDLEAATSHALTWLRNLDQTPHCEMYRLGYVVVTDKHGNHVRQYKCGE